MNLDQLPLLEEFKKLDRGDRVYSRQYGVGKVQSLYREDEVIVQFTDLRKRISIEDGLSKIPESFSKKLKRSKIEVEYNGKSISFSEFKDKNRAQKEKKQLEEDLLKQEQRQRRQAQKKKVQIELEFT